MSAARQYTVSEVSARSPDMAERDFAEFVENIRTNGQLVPIWVRGDEVIDGRKRLAACRRLGIEPKVVNLDPSQDAEKISHALNVLRTHYTPSQRAIFAAERATAKVGRQWSKSPNLENNEPVTVRQAADEAGVAPSSVSRAREIARKAAPEVTAAIKAGDLTIHAAGQIAESVPVEKQPAVVAKVVEQSRGKARQSPVGRVIEGVDVRANRPVPKKPREQFARALQLVVEGAHVCLTNAPYVLDSDEREAWRRELAEARANLTRILKTLETH